MRQKGIDGELIASDFLKKLGYKIITKNFHSRFGEVDIIASRGRTIVFVEVKLRYNNSFGTPLESITRSKLEKIKKTALFYLTLNNKADSDFRFDAVEILYQDGRRKINHVENITL